MLNEEKRQQDIVTVRLEKSIDLDALYNEADSKTLKIHMGISSIIGTQKNQQDTVFGHIEGDKAIAIVCDGMGGMNGGEIASQTAAKILAEDFFNLSLGEPIPQFFRREAYKMDEAVFSLTDSNNQPLNGGTTVVSVIVYENKLFWLSVGDSKIYIIRNGEIIAVNREHNYKLLLDSKLKKGLITEEEYKAEENQAEALVSYIGIGNLNLMDINESPFELLEDDIVILCSDGLYKRLSDEEIMNIVMLEEPDMERAARRLTDVVMKRTKKAQDNTSLVLLQYSRC
ncbi:MAG: PP2C family protein-serine/threonine phosphatase [Wujia sp.]